MTAPLREQFKNNGITTLNGGINNSTTSIVVTDGSVFPSAGNFRITIGSEIMLCTARSTNTLTVVRGYEGTTGASASNGANVVLFLTAGGLTRWAQDNDGLFGYASSPPLGTLVQDNGTTILTASDFTWVNQGSSTATDQNGTIVLRAPAAAGENIRALERSAPSAPYTYIMAMQGLAVRESVQQFGVGFRQSSSGKCTSLMCVVDGTETKRIAVYKHTNPTTFSTRLLSEANLLLVSKHLWFKLEDDNTNTKYYISMDGIEWIQVASESRTTFFTTTGPDKVFFTVHNQGSSSREMLGRLFHWSRAS